MHDEDQIGREKVRASHADGYGATEEIELVAVADVDEENLATFGEAWDVPDGRRYDGHEAMFDAVDLENHRRVLHLSLHRRARGRPPR